MAIPDSLRDRPAGGGLSVGSRLVVLRKHTPTNTNPQSISPTPQSTTRPHSTPLLKSSKHIRRVFASSQSSTGSGPKPSANVWPNSARGESVPKTELVPQLASRRLGWIRLDSRAPARRERRRIGSSTWVGRAWLVGCRNSVDPSRSYETSAARKMTVCRCTDTTVVGIDSGRGGVVGWL
ncbi:hypothetical protein HMN09_00397000 [Mycena chlorophos]|uniref:Uncharacterized protein n=1 Tax=Mycena chlorophos TaxID=658473 RepID=A0A8H6WLB8_MYCCL|nr:hypothetical protein HMN09_00397000 [Mycena chlorophos]